MSCVQQLCIAFVWNKPLSIAAVAISALGNITFPAISSIKSKSVPRHEQVRSALLSPVEKQIKHMALAHALNNLIENLDLTWDF